MTAQLSRERLEQIASWEIEITDAGTRHAPGAHSKVYSYEIVEMARMLLSGMDSVPVAKVDNIGVCWYADDGVSRKPAVGAALYAAAPAPVAVPDELTREEYKRRFMEEDNFDDTYRGGWKDYRAAMLKAGPVTAATVPDGWKLVPVEPTMPQELAGHKTLTDTGKMSRLMKTRISNIYRAMLAAAPAAPEQEV